MSSDLTFKQKETIAELVFGKAKNECSRGLNALMVHLVAKGKAPIDLSERHVAAIRLALAQLVSQGSGGGQ